MSRMSQGLGLFLTFLEDFITGLMTIIVTFIKNLITCYILGSVLGRFSERSEIAYPVYSVPFSFQIKIFLCAMNDHLIQ